MPGAYGGSAPNGRPQKPGSFVPWQSFQIAPKVLEICWLPASNLIPGDSIIRSQKREIGFFKHPIIVTRIDHERQLAYFYATTSHLSSGISDLKMFFKIGSTIHGDADTLKLERGSLRMKWTTYVNLEQRFEIEWRYLQTWAVPVRVDPTEIIKLENRIQGLERKQNRCKCLLYLYQDIHADLPIIDLYKPLPMNLRIAEPGTVLWL